MDPKALAKVAAEVAGMTGLVVPTIPLPAIVKKMHGLSADELAEARRDQVRRIDTSEN
jgi:hypothetical protein